MPQTARFSIVGQFAGIGRLVDDVAGIADINIMREYRLSRDKIMQIAYVVPDLEAAVQAFAMQLDIGGWIIVDRMTVPRMMYRGTPSDLALKIGLAYQGNMMYEFIQPLSDVPSVYKDTIDTTGYGFHHFGVLVESLEKEISTYRARGFDLACDLTTDAGGNVAYMDTRGSLPGMLELFEDSASIREVFKVVWDHQGVLQGSPNILRV